MFSDPMVSLMFMLLLCFVGMLVMFLFVIRTITAQANALRDGFAGQQKILDDVEQRLMEATFALRALQAQTGREEPAGTALEKKPSVPRGPSALPREGGGASRPAPGNGGVSASPHGGGDLLPFPGARERHHRPANGRPEAARTAESGGRGESDFILEDLS